MSATAEPLGGTFALTSRHVALAGCVLAALAFWIALPPVHGRSIVWPIVFGAGGVLAGAWAVRNERKLGVTAAVASLLGALLGVLATRSSIGNLDNVFTWSTLIAQGLVFATPLIFASMGGLFSERSGVVNIGLEGMMLMGCFWGIYGADKTGSWIVGILIGMASGGLLALIHAFFAIHLRADQIVGGTAINFLALGITGYFFFQLYAGANIPAGVPSVPNLDLHISGVYFFGPAFGDLDVMIWIAFLVVLATYVVVFKTPIGLRIRACGEHPRAADTVGINVYAVRYACVVLSGMLAAAGGAYLSLGAVGSFNENMTNGRGFIALAALIFGNWRPFGAAGAALMFGISNAIAIRMQTYAGTLPGIDTLILTLPYFITLIAVAGVIGRSSPPAAVGRPYKKQ
jgi:general nucleoside transport system permease protein